MDGESLDSLSEQLDSASLDAAELDSEPATSETTGNQNCDKWRKKKLRDFFFFVRLGWGSPGLISLDIMNM